MGNYSPTGTPVPVALVGVPRKSQENSCGSITKSTGIERQPVDAFARLDQLVSLNKVPRRFAFDSTDRFPCTHGFHLRQPPPQIA